jgi:hypothetical protein
VNGRSRAIIGRAFFARLELDWPRGEFPVACNC